MVEFDLIHALRDRGVSLSVAKRLSINLKGTDVINLINSLQGVDEKSTKNANKILKNYNVTVRGITVENKNIFKNLIPLKESVLNDSDYLLLSGYDYTGTIDNKISDKLMDCIDNKINYLTDGIGNFYFQCKNKKNALHLDNIMERLTTTFSKKEDERIEEMAKNGDFFKKKANDIKNKMSKIKPKDPNLSLANKLNLTKGGETVDSKKKISQTDKFGRNAKHKKQNIDESIMGNIKNMDTLCRLKELAGINSSVDAFDNDFVDDDILKLNNIPDTTSEELPDFKYDDLEDNMNEFEEDTENSEAMDIIEYMLNNIQKKLSDIRLREFKPLIVKLKDITNQIQTTGCNYLSERRRNNAI